MHVEDLRKLRSDGSQAMLEFRIAYEFFGLLDGGWFALNVRHDFGDLRDVLAHIGFKFGDLVVSLFEAHALIQFDMLLDVEAAVEVLHADVVDIEIPVSRDAANAIEDILGMLGASQRLNRHVGIGQDAMDGIGHGRGYLLRTLKGNCARESDHQIGKIPIPCPPDTDTINFEYAVQSRDRVVNLRADPRGRGIEKRVDGAAGQTPADRDDDPGDDKSSDRIGIAQPLEMVGAAEPDQNQSKDNNASGPDVG